MMRNPVLSLMIVSSLLVAGSAAAQGAPARLQVRARDAGGMPVSGAEIRVSGVERVARTDSTGGAVVEGIPVGSQWVDIFREGFGPERVAIDFTPAANVEMDVDLTPIPVRLSELIVTARNQSRTLRNVGFYERQRKGLGSFVDAERLEELKHQPDLYLALQHLRGFVVSHNPASHNLVIRSTRGAVSLQRGCVPDVLVDGFAMDMGYLSSLMPAQIEGIEAYAGPGTTPAKLVSGRMNGAVCGTIAIWLKH
jgi:hypothetical protein